MSDFIFICFYDLDFICVKDHMENTSVQEVCLKMTYIFLPMVMLLYIKYVLCFSLFALFFFPVSKFS